MKVSKIICDICGKEIEKSRPDRIALQSYQENKATYGKQSIYHAYKDIERFEVCEECCKDLIKRLGGKANEKDRE